MPNILKERYYQKARNVPKQNCAFWNPRIDNFHEKLKILINPFMGNYYDSDLFVSLSLKFSFGWMVRILNNDYLSHTP